MVKILLLKKRQLIINSEIIYVRLHPTLSKYQVRSVLKKIKFPFLEKIVFISSNNETIDQTILSSIYCVFADSNLINKSLKLNSKTIVVKSSFLYQPPIYSANINHPYLELV